MGKSRWIQRHNEFEFAKCYFPVKSAGMSSRGPLAGIRVVEMGGYSAAFAGRLLADAGADVARVYGPPGSDFDQLSHDGPWFGKGGPSIQAAWYNAGKRTLRAELRLDDPDDAEARGAFLSELIGHADILIESWEPSAPLFARDELAAANPDLVHLSVTPFGLTGPRAQWRSNDLIANAMSGSASVTGSAESGPINGYGNQTHHTVGFYAAVCALASLRVARSTGQYQHVEISEYEALVTCTEQVLMQWFFPEAGTWGTAIAARQGSLHWSKAYEVYPASDGRGVMVTAALRFADVLLPWLAEQGAAQDLVDSEKYPNVVAMIRDLPYVMKVLREWVATRDSEWLMLEGQKRHQPFGVAWTIEEALTRSPQIAARGYLQPVEIPGFGPAKFPGRMFRTSADNGHVRLPEDVDEFDWLPRGARSVRTRAARFVPAA
jgi:crotonobetainyl-CoA:carnitine CoA-transferase CaiB-like acyl-CoA transferase